MILYKDPKNNENSWTNAPTLGTNYVDKSLQIPTHCPKWGRWGLTMIGALHVTPITAYPTTITTYCSVVANHAIGLPQSREQ